MAKRNRGQTETLQPVEDESAVQQGDTMEVPVMIDDRLMDELELDNDPAIDGETQGELETEQQPAAAASVDPVSDVDQGELADTSIDNSDNEAPDVGESDTVSDNDMAAASGPSDEDELTSSPVGSSDVAPSSKDVSIIKQAEEKYGRGNLGWTTDQARAYLDTGTLPPKTPRGNWVTDTRRMSNLSAITPSELLDFMEGLLNIGSDEDQSILWDVVRSRHQTPGDWSNDAVREYALNHTPPARSTDGVLIQSKLREGKSLKQWTYQEVRAALLNEIDHPFEKADLIKHLRDLTNLQRLPEDRLLNSLTTEKYSNMATLSLTAVLEDIAKNRNSIPRPDPVKFGASHKALYDIIKRTLTRDYPEFNEAWNTLLDWAVREEHKLMAAKNRYKYLDHAPMKGAALQEYTDLVKLLVDTCQPERRRSGQQPQFIRTLVNGIGTEPEREKLHAFYRLG